MDGAQRTPEYEAAVAALKRLSAATGGNTAVVAAAFAEAACLDREQAWAARFGLKPSGGHPCIARLWGKRCMCSDLKSDLPCYPPGADHRRLWLRDGKPAVYTFEPYHLDHETLRCLVEFCERWELELGIHAWPASHYPGEVLWVEITPKGKPLR